MKKPKIKEKLKCNEIVKYGVEIDLGKYPWVVLVVRNYEED